MNLQIMFNVLTQKTSQVRKLISKLIKQPCKWLDFYFKIVRAFTPNFVFIWCFFISFTCLTLIQASCDRTHIQMRLCVCVFMQPHARVLRKLMGESAPETSQAWLDDVRLRSRLKSFIRRGLNCSGTLRQSLPTWSRPLSSLPLMRPWFHQFFMRQNGWVRRARHSHNN